MQDADQIVARLTEQENSAGRPAVDLSRVYASVPVGLCSFDADLRYTHINQWLATINGRSVEEHIGRPLVELIPDVADGVESQIRRVLETGEPVLDGTVEAETPAQPGVKRVFQHSYFPVESEDGTVNGVSCIVQDVTERERAEQALRQSEERYRTHAEAERQRIGRQLHDSLGQEISSVGMMASTLRELLGADSPHADLLDKLEATADLAKSQLRNLIKGILPVAVDAHGLVVALEELAEQTRNASGVACAFDCRDVVPLEDNFTATQLLLIAREAVHNAIKHASAGQIVIRIEEHNGVTLSVEDDGTGLRGDVDQTLGLGLRIMHHRAGLIDGTLSLNSPATGGTIMTCSVRQ